MGDDLRMIVWFGCALLEARSGTYASVVGDLTPFLIACEGVAMLDGALVLHTFGDE